MNLVLKLCVLVFGAHGRTQIKLITLDRIITKATTNYLRSDKGRTMKLEAYKHGLALILATTVLVGCETTSTADEEPVEPTAEQTGEASGTGAGSDEAMTEQQLAEQKAQEAAEKEQAAMREVKTVYFDLDQSTIKSEFRAPLAAHAAYLMQNPEAKIVVEGHCDERGTKEYNIALGERRGNSVAQFLKVNGVQAAQIEVVSYGEERPAMPGSNDSAWSKNRRAVLQYQ